MYGAAEVRDASGRWPPVVDRSGRCIERQCGCREGRGRAFWAEPSFGHRGPAPARALSGADSRRERRPAVRPANGALIREDPWRLSTWTVPWVRASAPGSMGHDAAMIDIVTRASIGRADLVVSVPYQIGALQEPSAAAGLSVSRVKQLSPDLVGFRAALDPMRSCAPPCPGRPCRSDTGRASCWT